MFHLRRSMIAWALAACSAGCGAAAGASPVSASTAAAEPAPTAESSQDETGERQSTPDEMMLKMAHASETLAGLWVEFWSPHGDVATERYLFSPDGRYAWHKQVTDACGPPAVADGFHTGAWHLDYDRLQLHEGSEPDAARAKELTVADCPINDEAERADDAYRCLVIGNRTFWRREAYSDALWERLTGAAAR